MKHDLDALVNAGICDEFAEAVTYDPRISAPTRGTFAARGVFDADHELIFTEVPGSKIDAPGHSTTAPVIGMRPGELALDPKQGDRITIRGVVYEVWDIHPDGDGWVDMILRKRV